MLKLLAHRLKGGEYRAILAGPLLSLQSALLFSTQLLLQGLCAGTSPGGVGPNASHLPAVSCQAGCTGRGQGPTQRSTKCYTQQQKSNCVNDTHNFLLSQVYTPQKAAIFACLATSSLLTEVKLYMRCGL